MMLPSHGPEPCASANSATSAHCGRWDLNPHEHTPTRSLVLPVCQFQHSRLLFFNFLCPMIFSPTKSSIAQFHLNCKPVFRKFIPEFIWQNPVTGHTYASSNSPVKFHLPINLLNQSIAKTRQISVPGFDSSRRSDLNPHDFAISRT